MKPFGQLEDAIAVLDTNLIAPARQAQESMARLAEMEFIDDGVPPAVLERVRGTVNSSVRQIVRDLDLRTLGAELQKLAEALRLVERLILGAPGSKSPEETEG